MWEAPKVEKGQMVLYKKSPAEHCDWLPAITVQIGERCNTLHIFIKSGRNVGVTLEKTRCHHQDDPVWLDPQHRESLSNDSVSGCWTLTPRDLLINQLMDEHFEQRKPSKWLPDVDAQASHPEYSAVQEIKTRRGRPPKTENVETA